MDGVADDYEVRTDQVGASREMGRVVAHQRVDAGALEQRAHGWIQGDVGALDAVALLLQKARERRHSRPPMARQ